jgi:hypothetical protein
VRKTETQNKTRKEQVMCEKCDKVWVERKTTVWKRYEVPACIVVEGFKVNDNYSMDYVGKENINEYETDEFNWDGMEYEDEWWYNEDLTGQQSLAESLKGILSCPNVMSDAEKLKAALEMLEDWEEEK